MDTPLDPFPVTQSGDSQSNGDARYRNDRFSVMTTAACTAASVSLLTLWLWMPAPVHVNDSGGTVSVTYELLDSAVLPQEAEADLVPTRSAPAVVPVAQQATLPPLTERARPVPRLRSAAATPDDLERIGEAAGPSRIAIVTQPAGASVTINGVGYGTTPLTIPYLPPGAKRIRVTKAGYETEERYYSSDAARASSLRITLRETVGAGATR